MTKLSDFPITQKWAPKNENIIQLYSLATPNGVKSSIMLEECGLEYDAHYIDFSAEGTKSDAFRSLNPNGKIPAIIDPNGPNGEALGLWESGAILYYLAQKTGKFLPKDPNAQYETLQWVFFQMASIGPMFGQLGYFYKFDGKEIEDKRPLTRYVDESKRLLGVLDKRFEGRDWIMDEYSIADIAILGWVRNLIGFYAAGDLVGFDQFKNVARVLDVWQKRPAVARGLEIPKQP